MTIEITYSVGEKVKCKVDGGDAMGKITALTYRLNSDGSEHTNYEILAKYYSDVRRRIITERQIIATNDQLKTWNAVTKLPVEVT